MASLGSQAPSVASSYLPMNASQQPSPPTAEQTGVPSVIEPSADDDAFIIGGGSSRPASPVGSMMVEVSESIAPSMIDSEEDAGSPDDLPGTPRADSVALPLDDNGSGVAAASMAKLSLDAGEQEPEIEEAELVPALEAKEAEHATKPAGAADVGIETPPASVQSDNKEHGVDSWLDDVAAQNLAADNGAAKADSPAVTKQADKVGEASAGGLAPQPTATTAEDKENGSVYFTPTLEFSSPELPVSDMPSDEEGDRTLAADNEALRVDDVTGETGLITPKSATVTDFRALQETEPEGACFRPLLRS